MRIGITGSLSSGKSTVAKIIAKKKYPLFSADQIVKNLYSTNAFKNKIKKKLNLKTINVKEDIKIKLLKKEISLKKLSKIIHPYVRKNMFLFFKKHSQKKFMILEIPLLIESKLYNYFDLIILVLSPKKIRLKRYIKNGGQKKLFNFLDERQIKQQKKRKYCDFIIVNNGSKKNLKSKVNDIIQNINV